MSWALSIRLLAAPGFFGEWIHTLGRKALGQKGKKVTGSAGRGLPIDGTVEGPELACGYREGAAKCNE